MVFLSFHGPFRVLQGESVVSLPAKSAGWVIAYLALQRGRPIQRRDLARLLWPEHSSVDAMTNLRTALYRVRKSFPNQELVAAEGENLSINLTDFASDLNQADRHHRTYLLASNQNELIKELKAEWEIRRQAFLQGWDEEWVESYRHRFEIKVHDLASELAKALESADLRIEALGVWNELLARSPNHAEALQNILRLEYSLNGKQRALDVANHAVDAFRDEGGIAMPRELQRVIRAIKIDALENVPPPELVKNKNEILLLLRMFESNLKSNGNEALALLARETTGTLVAKHGRTLLTLLSVALRETEGTSEARLSIATEVTHLSSRVSEFDLGHQWAEFVLDNTEESDPRHGSVLATRGFMYFEQRQYMLAEKYLEKAVTICESYSGEDHKYRAMSRLAGVRWHQLRFDEAIQTYQYIGNQTRERTDDDGRELNAMANGNLCFLHIMRMEWEKAVETGEACMNSSSKDSFYRINISGPLGVAVFAHGDKKRGMKLLSECVSQTCREGMYRYNQLAVDYSGVVLWLAGQPRLATCVFEANTQHRAGLLHFRSMAEVEFIQSTTGIDADKLSTSAAVNPLLGQSATTLSQWICEQFEKLELMVA